MDNDFDTFSANPPPKISYRIIMTQLQTINLLLCPYDTVGRGQTRPRSAAGTNHRGRPRRWDQALFPRQEIFEFG